MVIGGCLAARAEAARQGVVGGAKAGVAPCTVLGRDLTAVLVSPGFPLVAARMTGPRGNDLCWPWGDTWRRGHVLGHGCDMMGARNQGLRANLRRREEDPAREGDDDCC